MRAQRAPRRKAPRQAMADHHAGPLLLAGGPDLVNRDFTAAAPNELWVADFSYLRCWEGVVFFSFVDRCL